MKVCEYCGNENDGKRSFCYTCGAPLGSDQAAEEVRESGNYDDIIIQVNGMQVNISEIHRTHGTNKFRGIKRLREVTGAGLAEAKKAYEDEVAEVVRRLDRGGYAYCPVCQSTSLSAKKRGFGPEKSFEGKAGFGLSDIAKDVGDVKAIVRCKKCDYVFFARSK